MIQLGTDNAAHYYCNQALDLPVAWHYAEAQIRPSPLFLGRDERALSQIPDYLPVWLGNPNTAHLFAHVGVLVST